MLSNRAIQLDYLCEKCVETMANTILLSSTLLDRGSKNGYIAIALSLPNDCSEIHVDSFFRPTQLNEYNQFNFPFSEFCVETFPYVRKLPLSKSITWPSDRLFIENLRGHCSKEIILIDPNNSNYLEGLTSNLFVVDSTNCIIYTAPSNQVLPGSMRKLVIAACRKLNMKVEQINITPDVISLCDAAFLTSATKPIVPITAVHLHPHDYNAVEVSSVAQRTRCPNDGTIIHFKHNSKVVSELTTYFRSQIFRQVDSFLVPMIPYQLWWPLDPSGGLLVPKLIAAVETLQKEL